MTLQHPGLDTHPDNVIAFPRPSRGGVGKPARIARKARGERAISVSGADLNARLLLLLGICVSSAAILFLAVHILQAL